MRSGISQISLFVVLGLFSIVLAEVVYALQRRSTPWARVERIR